MSYGLFNWWWGEKDAYDWSWLINHLNEIVEDVKPNQNTRGRTLLMQHHTETKEFNLGWLDFRFLPLSEHPIDYDVDTVGGITNIANWMGLNITILLQKDGTYGNVNADTITSFIQTLKTHRPFYEENILKGEPFVWIPKIPADASLVWYDDLWDKIDRLMVDIGEGFICINPEANRAITHFLSDNWTYEFQTVADTVDWNYPKWYLDGSPL